MNQKRRIAIEHLEGIMLKNFDEYVSTLYDLGLSISQAKVLLSLAKAKNLKAQEISSISGVSRPDVYRVLLQLEEAGLVEKTISKPEEFHSISIEKCVSILIQRRILKTAKLQQKALELTQNFERGNENEDLSKEFQFVLIPNKEAVYTKAEKMIRSARKIICFMALRKRLTAWILNYSSIIEEALTRKVDFRIIMPKPEMNVSMGEPLEAIMKYPNFALRLISESPNVGFSVWDKKEMLLSTSEIDTPFPYPTLWSNNKSIVDLTQGYFDVLWQKAQKTETKRKMIMADIDT
jgi:sugar-specific transcriptional regulator TrmB